MLGLACRNTGKLIRNKVESDNVRLGRFFTKRDTAALMARMPSLDENKTAYTVLDAGAGTGILSAAMVEEICKRAPNCRQIFLTCYENNKDYVALLEDNLERIRKKARHDYNVKMYYTVYEENYLTESVNHYTVSLFDKIPDKYDIIICNPPTHLVDKGDDEALAAGDVTQVKINAAYLFAKVASTHLEEGGQLVIMLPTAFASSTSLSTIRCQMRDRLALEKIHLFIGKKKNEKRAIPLKKSMILCYANAPKPQTVTITTSTDSGKPQNTALLPALPYSFVVDESDGSLTLPKSVEDTGIVKYITAFPETLRSLGLKISTGLVIDSRCEGLIFTEPIKSCVPLIRPAAIRNGQIRFPLPIKHQYIAPSSSTLFQKNKNMIIIKRVPAKSDNRLLNTAVYMASQLPQYKYISTHNKVCFIDTKDKNSEMSARMVFGLFALLNSTIYDRYFSIVSKSSQISAKNLRDIPLPPRNIIENIGMRLMAARMTSVEMCDSIVNPTLHIKSK